MTTGLVLLFAVACLGGAIATIGDRIGMKVGKSRLSLFNLRPRQTATLVSVVTGMVASFSTLMLMIALDDQLRKGLFQLDDIQLELKEAQADLEDTKTEKEAAENSLTEANALQAEAQAKLRETNASFRSAVARQEDTLASLLETQSQLSSVSEQAKNLRGEIGSLRSERQTLIEEQTKVRSQITQRDQQIAERNEQLATQELELSQRNTDLAERDTQIIQRDQEIAERENRLGELQTQQAFLSQEIAQLEEEFRGLRLGNVAIGRNETLAFTLARPSSEAEAQRAVEESLAQANRYAAQTILPGTDTVDNAVIRFDPATVQQIVRTIADQQDYVIRVASAANYVVGEPCVNEALTQGGAPCLLVNVEAAMNEIRFQPGEVLASIQVDAANISNERLIERFTLLRATSQLQARRNGIIRYNPIIANGLSDPILEFLSQVKSYGETVQIQAFASQPIFTIGPVYLELAAVQNDRVLFRTRADPS